MTELTSWEPVELDQDDTAVHELLGHCPRENPGATSRLNRTAQNVQMSSLEADSDITLLDRSGIANRMMHASPTMIISTSTTRSFHDEKGAVIRSRNRSQRSLPTIYSSLNFDNRITHSQNAASLVNDLVQAVYISNDAWMNILGDNFGRSDIDVHFATSSPFTMGIKAWKQCFCVPVRIPLMEIFSLLRIAFAAACRLHHGEESYPWDHFFKNVLRWGEAIANPKEKELFLRAAYALQSLYNGLKGNYSQKYCVCSSWVASSQVSPRGMKAERTFGSTPLMQGSTWHEPALRSFSIDTQTPIIHPTPHFMQGLAMTACTQYLDCM